MKTSAIGRAAVEAREGRRLSAYRDTRGIWTIGVGHAATGLPPRPYAGMTITEAQCDALLAADLAPVEAVINAAVTVPISQNEFDAMASLGFNIGVGGLRKSSVVRLLNRGDVHGAADAFMNWCKPTALTGRREKEREQFLTPDPPDDAGVSASHKVVAARSAALSERAARLEARSKTSVVGGAVSIAAGAAATASAAAAGASYWPWVIGGIFAAGAALDGIVIVMRAQSAATLSANAGTQRDEAATLRRRSQPAKA